MAGRGGSARGGPGVGGYGELVLVSLPGAQRCERTQDRDLFNSALTHLLRRGAHGKGGEAGPGKPEQRGR